MTTRRAPILMAGLALLVAGPLAGQQRTDAAERERRYQEELARPRPIEALATPWIDELTWMEVRDRIAEGYTTAIVPTGGIEQNGPYLANGKHNVILRAACPAIAEKVGRALCAPVVKFVPEGDVDAIRYPGTISVRDETYRLLLEDIGRSLRSQGFTDVVYIGDSGGNQEGMARAAEALNERWAGSGARAHFVREFYTPGWEATEDYTRDVLGVSETESDGYHDDIWVTAMMMITDPSSVRWDQRVAAGLASINGVDISRLEETVLLGRRMMDFRADLAAKAIREAIGR